MEDYKEKDGLIIALEEEVMNRKVEVDKLNDEKYILKAICVFLRVLLCKFAYFCCFLVFCGLN